MRSMKTIKKYFLNTLPFIIVLLIMPGTNYSQQISIPRIDQMPDLPAPYLMRNWKEVASGYDSLVFNQNISGTYLPLIWTNNNSINYPGSPQFGLHTVVGTPYPTSAEAINCIPAVIGASLAGIDKSNQNGYNWVQMCAEWFNKKNGLNVYKNHPDDQTADDWWYETMPNVFFYELNYLYPDIDVFNSQFTTVADRWLEAVKVMGGSSTPWSIPNMDHRGWDLNSMQPYDADVHEPEAAGAIGWILYNAYVKTKNEKYRVGAEWCMEFLTNYNSNPAYELQLAYGVYTAARMNAELGTNYDISKMVNWCFDVGRLRSWGAMANTNWGGYDVDGLIGEVNGVNDYPFAMNTFEQIGALVPMVRYDARFARAIGKWVLNAANASRLFYPQYLPAQNQDQPSKQWADQYDTNSYIAHEAIRKYNPSNFSITPYATGDAIDGNRGNTNLTLYGSSHIGILGGIIDTTNVSGILKLDLLKTDYYRSSAYPSYLLYNPYSENKVVEINTGSGNYDIYDVVSKEFLATGVTGVTNITVPLNNAALIVIVPSGGTKTYEEDKFLVDGITVDYHSGKFSGNYPPRIKSLSSTKNILLFNDTTAVYCTAVDPENDSLIYQWSASGGKITGSGAIIKYISTNTAGVYRINCTVSDGKGNIVTAKDTINVSAVINNPPSILKIEATPRKIDLGKSSVLFCNAVDPQNDSLIYSWYSSEGVIEGAGNNVNWTAPSTAGNYYIGCTVNDGKGGSASDSILVEVRDFSKNQTGSIVASYSFSGNADDGSGNNNNGIAYDAFLTSDRFGTANSAYMFNGVNSYIQVPSSQSLNFSNGLTINLWMTVKDFYSREQYVISHGSYNTRWKISIIPEKKLRFTIKTNSSQNGGIIDLDSETLLNADSLYNITAAYNGADVELYINGNLDSFASWSGAFLTTNIPLTIGQELPNNNNTNFSGVLDDIKIYNFGLSYNEIQNLFSGATDVNKDNTAAVPEKTELMQNYPNPFNPSTKIYFMLNETSDITLSIYNILGQKITELAKGEFNAGNHYITWNASDYSSGIYFCVLQANGKTFNKKLILLK